MCLWCFVIVLASDEMSTFLSAGGRCYESNKSGLCTVLFQILVRNSRRSVDTLLAFCIRVLKGLHAASTKMLARRAMRVGKILTTVLRG